MDHVSAGSALEQGWAKFREAEYFSMLVLGVSSHKTTLVQVQEIDFRRDGASIRSARPVEDEITYLFSAFLNAAYSVTQYLKAEDRFAALAITFLRSHPEFYAHGSSGGYRTLAVHYQQVRPGFRGRRAEPWNAAWQSFWDFVDEGGMNGIEVKEVETSSLPDLFYLDESDPQLSIDMVCNQHLFDLQNLLSACDEIEQGASLGNGGDPHNNG